VPINISLYHLNLIAGWVRRLTDGAGRQLAIRQLSKVTGPWAQLRRRSARGHCDSAFYFGLGFPDLNIRSYEIWQKVVISNN
jgi:hypothetical protein